MTRFELIEELNNDSEITLVGKTEIDLDVFVIQSDGFSFYDSIETVDLGLIISN